MAKTPSTMLPLGTKAPAFALPDLDGRSKSLADFAGKPLLVMFICNHCPYVKLVAAELALLGREAAKLGVGVVAISSNDAEAYPADGPVKMAEEAKLWGYTFPYLYDQSQDVARAYQAACTPDFYLFDQRHLLVYRGQLDGSRPGNGIPVTGSDLRQAITALCQGHPISSEQRPSIGCNIKWRQPHA